MNLCWNSLETNRNNVFDVRNFSNMYEHYRKYYEHHTDVKIVLNSYLSQLDCYKDFQNVGTKGKKHPLGNVELTLQTA